jgi:hypothetical protein
LEAHEATGGVLGTVLGASVGVAAAVEEGDGDELGSIDAEIDGKTTVDGDAAPCVEGVVGDDVMQALTRAATSSVLRPRAARRGFTRIGRAPASHV